MKKVFLDITEKLDNIQTLQWIDEDKGQLNFERPPVLFPCALVDIQLPKTDNLNARMQRCDMLITVRVAFDFSGNTSKGTPEAARAKSLEYYDIVEEVYKALQGYATPNFNPLERKSFYQEKRPDGYKVVAIPFTSEFRDTSAVPAG